MVGDIARSRSAGCRRRRSRAGWRKKLRPATRRMAGDRLRDRWSSLTPAERRDVMVVGPATIGPGTSGRFDPDRLVFHHPVGRRVWADLAHRL